MEDALYSENKKYIIKPTVVLLSAMALTLFTVLYFRRIENLSEISLFHVATNAFCVIQTIIIYIGLSYSTVLLGKGLRYFLLFIALNAECCFTWGMLWIANGLSDIIIFRYCLYYIQYAASYLSAGFFMLFIRAAISDELGKDIGKSRRDFKIYIGLGILSAIFIASGVVFSIDSAGEYHKGMFDFVPCLMMIVLCIAAILLYSQDYGYKNIRPVIKSKLLPFLIMNIGTCVWLIISPYYEPTVIMICSAELMIYCSSYKDMLKRNRFLSESFKRYATSADVTKNGFEENGLKLGGERMAVSVLMCNIRGLNDVVRTESPERSAEMLNHIFGEISGIIEKNRGTVLGIPGNAVLSVFGAPEAYEGYAERAVDSALEIRNGVSALNEWNRKNGFAEISLGIGVSTGESIVGNIGSENHMRYSAISRMVNLSSRLESFAADNEILITEFTKNACENIETDEGSTSFIKGYSGKVPFYSLYGRTELQ